MADNQPGAQHPQDRNVPLWMRKSTLWVVLALSIGIFALIAYYLLPLWWAALVSSWVKSTNSAVTGVLVGFLPVTFGLAAFRGAQSMSTVGEESVRREKARHFLRLLLGALAGLGLVVLILTVSIALGFTEPLRQARELWQDHAPGVLIASLIGALLGVIGLLAGYTIRLKWRERRTLSPPSDDASASQ